MLSAIRRSSPVFLGDSVRCCLFYCIVLCVVENGCHLPSCGLGATVGWVGAPKFVSTSFLKRVSAWCWQWRSSPFSGNPWCRGARRRGGGDVSPLLQAPGRDHPSLFCFVVGQHAVAG